MSGEVSGWPEPEVLSGTVMGSPEPTAPVQTTYPTGTFVGAVLCYYAAYLPFVVAFVAFLPLARAQWTGSFEVAMLLAFGACFLSLGLAIYTQALMGFGEPSTRRRALAAVGLLGFALFVWSYLWMRDPVRYNTPVWVLANTIGLCAWTTAAGFAVSRGIQQSGHLIAVALVGMVVDLWSVMRGPSKIVAERVIEAAEKGVYQGQAEPPLLSFLLLRFPNIGFSELLGMLGMGDLIFLAFFFGCVLRFGLPPLKNYLTLTLGVIGALWLVNVLHERFDIQAIPALPILAPLFIVLNVRDLRMTPREWRITGIFVALLLLLMVGATAVQIVAGPRPPAG